MANAIYDVRGAFRGPIKTVRGYKIPAGLKLLRGCMHVDVAGSIYKAGDFTQAPLVSKILTVAGVDPNGGIYLYTEQANVRYVQITGGNNKVFSITPTFGSTIDITVQLATDGGGNSTTTAAALVAALAANALTSRLFRFGFTGTGAGLTAPSTIIGVPRVTLLGVAIDDYDNSSSLTDLVGDFGFYRGHFKVNSIASDPVTTAMLGSLAEIVDDNNVKATPGTLGWRVQIVDFVDGQAYADLR